MSKTVMSKLLVWLGLGRTPLALGAAAFAVAVGGAGEVRAQFDEAAFQDVCANAVPGSILEGGCVFINVDAPTRAAAAFGNNVWIMGAQGHTGTGVAAENVRERLEEVRQGSEGGGSAADWMIGKLGIFISGDGTFIERDSTELESGYDAAAGGVTAGADYRFSDAFVAGVAVNYSSTDTAFWSSAGGLDTDVLTGTLYASFAPDEHFFFDAYAGYAGLDYDGRRVISFTASGVSFGAGAFTDTDGRQWIAGAAAGYDLFFGPLTVGPHAQFNYSDIDIDGYTETGGGGFTIAFGDQSITSAESVLGAHASYAVSMSWGVLVPQGRLDWVHQFEDDARAIPASFVTSPGAPFTFVTDDPDRNFGRVGVSLVAVLPNGIMPFADYQYQFGHDFVVTHSVSAGLRIEF